MLKLATRIAPSMFKTQHDLWAFLLIISGGTVAGVVAGYFA